MSNLGQGLLSHLYPSFVCYVLILGLDIRLAFTGPLILWYYFDIAVLNILKMAIYKFLSVYAPASG